MRSEGEIEGEDEDEIVLPNGRRFYANCGIIGISAAGAVSEGYDGAVFTDDWTDRERGELARVMIERWRAFGGL